MAEHVHARPNTTLETLAAGASLLCAIHCALTPFVVAGAALSGAGLRGHWAIEAALLGFALVAGGLSLSSGHKKHGKPAPWLWFAAGVVALALAHAGLPRLELPLAISGGLMLAIAQLVDRKLVKAAAACACHA